MFRSDALEVKEVVIDDTERLQERCLARLTFRRGRLLLIL